MFNEIRYGHAAVAICHATEGDLYAVVRTIKRRSGQLAYEVSGYSRLKGCFPGLEGIYEARGRDEAIEAAYAIARQVAGRLASAVA
jgi:hypothetical protein